jgi:hypothetical protein
MSVTLEKEHGMPRSALRHRPIGEKAATTIKTLPNVPTRASRTHTVPTTMPVASKGAEKDSQPVHVTPSQTFSSKGAKTGQTTTQRIQKTASRATSPKQTGKANASAGPRFIVEKRKPHWLLLIGLGMSMAILLILLSAYAVQWGTSVWDTIQYGYPRTFQTDAFVGHESGKTPSHFVAMNLHGRVEILELPGGDASRAHLYVGPQLSGPDADQVPVTLQFVNTRDRAHPDMVVSFQNTQIVFLNENGVFRPS